VTKVKFYKSYNFRTKDPVIDQVRTIIQDEGVTYQQVHEKSGVTVTTLHNWFHGETRKPQFATIMAVARALGYDFRLVKGVKTVTKVPLKREAVAAAKEVVT